MLPSCIRQSFRLRNLIISNNKPNLLQVTLGGQSATSLRCLRSLTASQITQLLRQNEFLLDNQNVLPDCVETIECNQLSSNSPIEDRIRIASVQLPNFSSPTVMVGVFDGHGGGTTADLISSRLFNYIAVSLHPEPGNLKISEGDQLKNLVANLHVSPRIAQAGPQIEAAELNALVGFKSRLKASSNVAQMLQNSFKQCDEDLSSEIQQNLMNRGCTRELLHYYLSAAVSGCCALVMVIHDGAFYFASSGDCRAVLGECDKRNNEDGAPGGQEGSPGRPAWSGGYKFSATELNQEHNCDNINEVRRLAAAHPKSEQNTMIKHNRLLGHLMPFRAFGDFNYKWPADVIEACGITRAFGPGAVPSHYETPPYLIAEPDVRQIGLPGEPGDKYIVIASDGLWELFESSREVVETIVEHSGHHLSAAAAAAADGEDYQHDLNRATFMLRSALQSGVQQDLKMEPAELRRLHHLRLESTLSLPKAVVRNFRDDISIVVLRLR